MSRHSVPLQASPRYNLPCNCTPVRHTDANNGSMRAISADLNTSNLWNVLQLMKAPGPDFLAAACTDRLRSHVITMHTKNHLSVFVLSLRVMCVGIADMKEILVLSRIANRGAAAMVLVYC